jgi:hypothetical protein
MESSARPFVILCQLEVLPGSEYTKGMGAERNFRSPAVEGDCASRDGSGESNIRIAEAIEILLLKNSCGE